ncbi:MULTISPECIES: CBS domain-containing protein [unclassified Saccharothrix]|uniref:CBS domain-containing protein n=1 Tax=unclassified Saccharothrix TaxID=2593673 RepID=UPI00307F4342
MDPDAPIGVIARIMVADRVRWVPVVDGAELVGVVTRRDVVRILARGAESDRTTLINP